MDNIWQIDSDNNWNTISARWILRNRYLLLVFSLLTFFVYLLTPITLGVNSLAFSLTTILFYCFVAGVILPRESSSPVINGIIIIPILGMIFMGLPSSTSSQFTNVIGWPISEEEFKLKYLAVKLMPALLLLLLYSPKRKIRDNVGLVTISEGWIEPDKQAKGFSIVFLVISTVYLYSNIVGDLPVISYFSRIFYYAFQWYFFWLGFWNFRLGRRVFIFALVYVLIHTLINFISGGRYDAIILVMVFGLGYYLNQTQQIRKYYLLQLVWIIPLVIFLTGIVGLIRQEIGRGDFDILIKGGRIKQFSEAFSEASNKYFTEPSYRKTIYEETASRTRGGGALEAVVKLSPAEIPFRGTDNLKHEISSIFKIAALNTGFDKESIRRARGSVVQQKLGTAAANLYGFNVTERNSVEWPVSADGYSRAGLPGVFLYYLIAITWFIVITSILRRRVHNQLTLTVLFTVLVKIIYTGLESTPLYLNIRETILYLVFSFITIRVYILLSNVSRRFV